MKKADVKVGEVYLAKVSGKVVRVKLDAVSPFGGWLGTNKATGRQVRIKSAARLSPVRDTAHSTPALPAGRVTVTKADIALVPFMERYLTKTACHHGAGAPELLIGEAKDALAKGGTIVGVSPAGVIWVAWSGVSEVDDMAKRLAALWAKDPTNCMIVNNTDARIDATMAGHLVAHAMHATPLPSVYFEAFAVNVITVDGQRRAIVNWRRA